MTVACYDNGMPIAKGDAVLRSGVVPAIIIDVFDGDPASVWLEDAEQMGQSVVSTDLGDLTFVERSTQNYAHAGINFLQTLAADNDTQAQAALGWLYEAGVAVDADDAIAVAWYEKAAIGGDPIAQFNFALRCEKGKGTQKNLAAAARWYLAAAEQGIGPAMKNLSDMYRDGRGVHQDMQQAIRWFRAAEDAGCA